MHTHTHNYHNRSYRTGPDSKVLATPSRRADSKHQNPYRKVAPDSNASDTAVGVSEKSQLN